MHSETIWILDDDSAIRWVLQKAFNRANLSCTNFADPRDLLSQLEAGERPSVIVSDIRMPHIDGLTLLTKIQRLQPDIPVIVMTAHSDLQNTVEAYQKGAFDYLAKPFDIDNAVTLVKRALAIHVQPPSKTNQAVDTTSEIIGEAPAMQEVFKAIGKLSSSSVSVLINGESGTGKELVARALHRHSPRANLPFIALNMAAIPEELIESELFGHEKGAFTGAQSSRKGRFEQANGGTLFLDEIGDMPMRVQTRLLRVLAEGQFYRVGGQSSISVDVRIIAATHQHLEQRVSKGAFRADLFHRLNVIRIHLPTLNERSEDIPALCKHFLHLAAEELGSEDKNLHPDTLALLKTLPWPGNVRQLENTCRWLTVMASSQQVLPTDLPPELLQQPLYEATSLDSGDWQAAFAHWVAQQLHANTTAIAHQAQSQMEKILLEQTLKYTHGHKQQAAKLLGWGRNTLARKLNALAL